MADPEQDVFVRQEEIIDRVGWAVVGVCPTVNSPEETTPFAYTVGLTAHGYPELVIAGLDPRTSQALLNDLANRVYGQAVRFTHGQHVSDLIAGCDAVIVEGPVIAELLPGMAYARYGRNAVRLQQIVWPDKDGRFPWQDGYDLPTIIQPVIGVPDEH
ncbi:MAG: DUF4262 domain-containing protein [Mycobacterium sp.]|nr:DUF4262 domain-containing protein [Mycobacterium sp.]